MHQFMNRNTSFQVLLFFSIQCYSSIFSNILPQQLPIFSKLHFDFPHILDVESKTYYEILEINSNAELDEIKKSFRRLSLKYHPDRNGSEEAKQRYKEIKKAHDVLTEPRLRRIYDEGGEEALESEGRETQDPEAYDIFSHFFGDNRRREREPQKVGATMMRLRVTLEQLYFGDEIQVTYTRPILCKKADECYIKKKDCKGPGIRVVVQQMMPGFIMQNQISDSSCVQDGKAWKSNCAACPKGMKDLDSTRLTAFIERGMRCNNEITFEGVGEEKIGYQAGDLILTIETLTHDRFTRSADDLKTTVEITLEEALVGFSLKFTHIDKKYIVLKRTEVTYDGYIMVVENKGMPIKDHWNRFGNLFIKFKIKYPVSLNTKQKSLIKDVFKSVEYKLQN